MGLENRALVLVVDVCGDLGLERLEVDGDDGGVAVGCEPLDQAVADLTAGAGNQGHVLAHMSLLREPDSSRWRLLSRAALAWATTL